MLPEMQVLQRVSSLGGGQFWPIDDLAGLFPQGADATLGVMLARQNLRPIAALFAALALCAVAHAASWSVKNEPARLVNGTPILLIVKPPVTMTSLNGTLLGHTFSFAFEAKTKSWYAVAGISLETPPGKYPLALSGEAAPAKSSRTPGKIAFTRTLAVARAKYPKIELSVEKKFTEPGADELKEIEEAQKVKKDYLSRVTPEQEWAGKFSPPADAAISDVFGTQRVFNGEVKSSHQGLDFRVPTGTAVAAMNGGTVLLARPLYFEGNFIVLDHGQGLLTLYMHLSEFKVKEGEQVKRGQIIALSGGSGRATGPHLHVAVRWQGTYLDPATLLKLPLP